MPALDGVRALAVVAVLLYHGGVSWVRGGFLGVDIFFVLSGFLITALLLNERERRGHVDLRRFWSRRARRLLPALFLTLAGVLVYAAAVAPRDSLPALRGDVVSALAYVANWRFIFAGHSYFDAFAAPSPIEHLWSLAIEEQFYLVWPLALTALVALVHGRRKHLLFVTCSLAAASAVGMATLYGGALDSSRLYFGTDTRAQALLIGAALAIVGPHVNERVPRQRRLPHLAAGAALLIVVGMTMRLTDQSVWLYRGGYLLVAMTVAVLLAAVTTEAGGPVATALSWRPLCWIGQISYGLYLWHWPVNVFLTADRVGVSGATLLALRLVATLACAVPSYYLVERPVRSGALTGWTPRVVAPAAAAAIVVCITVIAAGSASPGATVARAKRASDTAPNEPRGMLVGDSVALTLGLGFQNGGPPGLSMINAAALGCGVVRGQWVFDERAVALPPHCARAEDRWRDHVARYDPQVVVGLWGLYDARDHVVDGRRLKFGSASFDEVIQSDLERVAGLFSARGARVVLLTSPYYGLPPTVNAPPRPDGAFDSRRVDHWNDLLRRVAARHPATMRIIDLNRFLSPAGRYSEYRGTTRMRSDGVHFTPEGATVVARWLAPQLRSLARGTQLARAGEQSHPSHEAPVPALPMPPAFPSEIPLCPGFEPTYVTPLPPEDGFNMTFRLRDPAACFAWMERAVTTAGYPVVRREFAQQGGEGAVFIYIFGAPGALADMLYSEVERHGLLLVTRSKR